jgi:hypothetical protein
MLEYRRGLKVIAEVDARSYIPLKLSKKEPSVEANRLASTPYGTVSKTYNVCFQITTNQLKKVHI